jgi:hypothetical protein
MKEEKLRILAMSLAIDRNGPFATLREAAEIYDFIKNKKDDSLMEENKNLRNCIDKLNSKIEKYGKLIFLHATTKD